MKYLSLSCFVLLLSCSSAIRTPDLLIDAMHTAYAKSYFKTLTFTQQTIETHQDGTTKEETWYESYRAPGDLSIRFDPVAGGNGILFTGDSIFSFADGEVKVARPLVHPLLLLGFDVYVLPPERTVMKLKDLGYDMSVLDEGTWDGRPAYIVGARAGDDSAAQFWIDKERLVFVRSVQYQRGMKMEVQFRNYTQVEGGWVGAEVVFLRNGETVTREVYSELKTNVEIDAREFRAGEWMYLADK